MDKAVVAAKWTAENDAIDQIVAATMQKYFDGLPDRQRAYVQSFEAVACVDDGIGDEKFPYLRLPGSGILHGKIRAEEIVRHAMRDGHNIIALTHHDDCGAAHKYSVEHGGDPYDNATAFVEDLAGPEHLDIAVREAELKRPVGLHTARAVYVDFTGHFDPWQVEGMLRGFVISAAYINENEIHAELDMTIEIAFGDHGFGELFDAKHPLLVVPVARKASDRQRVETELSQSLGNSLSKPDLKRIKVDGLVI